MSEDILNFIEMPMRYDFVEDTLLFEETKKQYQLIDDPFERFFLYRASTIKWEDIMSHADAFLKKEPREYSKRVHSFFVRATELGMQDPDKASSILQKIYQELWPDLVKMAFMRQKTYWKYMQQDDKTIVASDTMTSAQTSLSVAMEADEFTKNYDKIYAKGEKRYCTMNASVVLAANNEDTHFYEVLDEKYPNFKDFISLYHTLGNYCPVPVGFNVPRSGKGNGKKGALYDYWDLTLSKIYEWYCSFDEGVNENERGKLIKNELLHNHKDGNPENCKKWLEFFGEGKEGWKSFVDKLYFQDYVESCEHGDYTPKPFWAGHDWKNPAPPIEKCDEFFREASKRILKRGSRMIQELWKIILKDYN